MVEAVVHPLPVLPYVSRAIPSVLAPTGPSLAAPPRRSPQRPPPPGPSKSRLPPPLLPTPTYSFG